MTRISTFLLTILNREEAATRIAQHKVIVSGGTLETRMKGGEQRHIMQDTYVVGRTNLTEKRNRGLENGFQV